MERKPNRFKLNKEKIAAQVVKRHQQIHGDFLEHHGHPPGLKQTQIDSTFQPILEDLDVDT